MADETQILNGFYKGVPIAINSGSLEGGRKAAVKQFPSRDTQSVEDLGLRPRKYSLEIIISDKPDQDYFGYRNALLQALDTEGGGELIHPLYGRIVDVVAVNYSLNENFSAFGDSTVTVNFEVNSNTGVPQSSGNVITQISAANDNVRSAVNADISDNFSITDAFTGNFNAAVDKVNGIIDRTREATSFIGETSDTINDFAAQIGELSANVNSLVSDPLALAQSIDNLFQGVDGLYASAGATFDTFTGFFGFGEDDEEIRQDTASRIERERNNNILNGAVAASSLGYSYVAVSRVDFQTVRQVDELTAELDSQYSLVQNSGSSQEVKDAITDMRVQTLQALEQARVTAAQIITVETNPTTTRLLAFSYYGSDELGEQIGDLNNIADVSFIEGEQEILTA